MEDQIEPSIGLLNAFGVAVVVVAWFLVRGAGERARAAVAAFGAAMLALAFARLLGSASFVTSLLAGELYADTERWLRLLLVAAGVALGAWTVGYARQRAEEAAEDLAADAADAAEPGADDDAYAASRRRLVTVAPSLDVVALAVALALPMARAGWLGAYSFPGSDADVTVVRALVHVLIGFTGAAALLALVRRPGTDTRLVVGGAALIAVCSVVVPLWPGPFSNDFWAAFAAGLAAGLIVAVGLRLLADAVPEDRSLATGGALAALALLALTAWLSAAALSQSADDARENFSENVDRLPDGFPTELPTP